MTTDSRHSGRSPGLSGGHRSNRHNEAPISAMTRPSAIDRAAAAPGAESRVRDRMSARTTLERPISVWLVEDNHSFRHTVQRILSQADDLACNHDFANCEEALEELRHGAVPDVILLDVELP